MLEPLSTSVPEDSFVRFPAPLITELKSVPWVIVFDRLKASVAPELTEIELDPESEPVVPPLPIWSVPTLTVVAPV